MWIPQYLKQRLKSLNQKKSFPTANFLGRNTNKCAQKKTCCCVLIIYLDWIINKRINIFENKTSEMQKMTLRNGAFFSAGQNRTEHVFSFFQGFFTLLKMQNLVFERTTTL